jgi:transposase-like protein
MRNEPRLIKDLGMMNPKEKSKYKKRFGLYECPYCKKQFKAMTSNILKGNTKKCRSCASKAYDNYVIQNKLEHTINKV